MGVTPAYTVPHRIALSDVIRHITDTTESQKNPFNSRSVCSVWIVGPAHLGRTSFGQERLFTTWRTTNGQEQGRRDQHVSPQVPNPSDLLPSVSPPPLKIKNFAKWHHWLESEHPIHGPWGQFILKLCLIESSWPYEQTPLQAVEEAVTQATGLILKRVR